MPFRTELKKLPKNIKERFVKERKMKYFGLFFLVALLMALTLGQVDAQEKKPTNSDGQIHPMPHYIIDAPLRCKPNQKPDRNGKCRDIY
ncbi:UNVERIFIED_CONTAM: hypothetical protein PYX00_009076 [Menopon gallinae]|uniref:Uncharacterized protein n=1 Tax=Menopon gallinae TaxID=328185 RepID=A0AAW2H9N8_9NEOP